jgi:hypothetical protein
MVGGKKEKKKKNASLLPKNNLATFSCNMKLPTSEHRQEKGQIVNSATYTVMLKDKFKPAIHNNNKNLLWRTILLHHNNAHMPVLTFWSQNTHTTFTQ